MNYPEPGDYIDIHTHDSSPSDGIFIVNNLMAHEGKLPDERRGVVYSMGIHPWFLTDKNLDSLLARVREVTGSRNLAAFGEAGFDKLRGPGIDLERKAFGEQVAISEQQGKPLFIHCVKSWDELIRSHMMLKPVMPWLVHGFRGSRELAFQLLSRGMYLSFWFDFILRPESSRLVRSLPSDRIFLETDGAGVDIRDIYLKVSSDLAISPEELKARIYSNYISFFGNE